MIQKRRGFGPVLLRGFAIRVVRYEPLPKYRVRPYVSAATDKIDIAFLLSNKTDDELPWIFEAVHVRFNYEDVRKVEEISPYSLDEFTPVAISYCLSATDPGVYWVDPVIRVSAGIGRVKEITFAQRPIPIAFADFPPDQFKEFQGEFKEREVLEGINKHWIPWPPITETDRRFLLDGFNDNSSPPPPIE